MKDCHLTGREHPSVRLGSELLIQSMTTSFHPRRGTKESDGGPEKERGRILEQAGRSHQWKLVFFGSKRLLCLFYFGGRNNGTIQEVTDPAALVGLMVALRNPPW